MYIILSLCIQLYFVEFVIEFVKYSVFMTIYPNNINIFHLYCAVDYVPNINMRVFAHASNVCELLYNIE